MTTPRKGSAASQRPHSVQQADARARATRRAAAAKRPHSVRKAAGRKAVAKRNPPDLLATPRGSRAAGGVVIGREVIDLTYWHDQSRQQLPYKHNFGRGTLMIGLPDGSVLLKNPKRRLWEDRVVGENE